MAYVFSRSTDSVRPDYGAIAQSGATIALNAEDPKLQQAISDARSAGAKVAIWIPAHQGQDATQYGQYMASLVQHYQPDAILPNIEGAQGKASSGGNKWSSDMMNSFQQYVQPGSVKLDVVTEPGEKDFNYKPYLDFGGGVVNEAFTGDMQHKNVDQMRQQLIDAGVPPERINMLLAPGQDPGRSGNFSAYTWDDMNPQQQQDFLHLYSTALNNAPYKPATGYQSPAGPAGPQTYQKPGGGGAWQRFGSTRGALPPAVTQNMTTEQNPTYNQLPPTPPVTPNPEVVQPGSNAGFQQVRPPVGGAGQFTQVQPKGYTQGGWTQQGPLPDASNPAAQAYGRARLSQHGITVKKGEDAAAMWRDLSGKIAAARAVALATGSTGVSDAVLPNRPLTVPPTATQAPVLPSTTPGPTVDPGQVNRLATSRSGPVRY